MIELVCPGDWCERRGVRPSAFSNWRNRYADFPQPVYQWNGVVIFTMAELDGWARKHRPSLLTV